MEKYLILSFSLVILLGCQHIGDPYYFHTPDERSFNADQSIKKSFADSRFSEAHFQSLNDALLWDKTNDRAYYELAYSSLLTGQLIEWKTNIDAAVELKPERWKVQRAYHYMCFLNDYDAALLDLYGSHLLDTNQLVEIPFIQKDFLLAICYFKKGEFNQAKSFFSKHNEETDLNLIDPSSYLYLSQIAYLENDLELALKHIQAAFSGAENYAEYYFLKSKISKAMGDVETAKRTIERAISQWKLGFSLKEKHQQLAMGISLNELLLYEKSVL